MTTSHTHTQYSLWDWLLRTFQFRCFCNVRRWFVRSFVCFVCVMISKYISLFLVRSFGLFVFDNINEVSKIQRLLAISVRRDWVRRTHLRRTFSRSCTAEFIWNKWNKGNFSCSHSLMIRSVFFFFILLFSLNVFFFGLCSFAFHSINFSIYIRYLIVYLRFSSCVFCARLIFVFSSFLSMQFESLTSRFSFRFLNFVPPMIKV